MHAYVLLKLPSAPLLLPKGTVGALEVVGNDYLAAVIEPALLLEDLQQDDGKLLQAVLAHDRIIRELFAQTTVLPLRFTNFAPLPDLLADLEANRAQYLTTLSWLEGKAEYLLKLAPKDLAEVLMATDLTGKAYFLAKKQHYQAQHEQRLKQMEEMNQLLQAIAQPSLAFLEFSIANSESAIKSIYLLSRRGYEATLGNQIMALQEQSTYWEIELGEALPPYHFSDSKAPEDNNNM